MRSAIREAVKGWLGLDEYQQLPAHFEALVDEIMLAIQEYTK